MYKLKLLTYWLIAWPALLAYIFTQGDAREKIHKDLARYQQVEEGSGKKFGLYQLYRKLVGSTSFRSVYYMRVGQWEKILKYFLRPMTLCSMATKSCSVGGGIYIQHGWSMVLDAEFVGENLWINQNVTVGFRGNGHPRIGNNVRIGSGAVVLGPIIIGDNVNIGANAIVVEDIPSNVTVCSPKATIVKYHSPSIH